MSATLPRERPSAPLFDDEPEGWQRLKMAAQQAPDAPSLALIIDEMNRLLDHHQSMDIYPTPSEVHPPLLALEVEVKELDYD